MTVSNIYSVAVDGPSGAGKSTLSKEVAKELGIVYVDTGAIYRTIGYYIFTQGIDPKDERAVTAALPEVRVDMRYGADGLQRMFLGGMARRSSVIMDGRDIGTVVLPNAQVKIFLCADVQVRARRRTLELEQRGTPKPYEQVLEEMEQRDWADSHRSAAPLRPAEDAVVVDTTNMDFAQSKDAILQVIRRRTQP